MNSFFQDLFIQTSLCRSGKYISVKGKNLYYETYGEGEPFLMFHGGLSCLDTFRYQIPFFARHFQVILPERPGNGHVKDTEGDYKYEDMAEDMIAFMEALNLPESRMLGYSDGANLIYFMAMKRPDLIERFISVGGNFNCEGCVESFQEELRQIPKDSCGEGVDRNFQKYSPHEDKAYVEIFHKHLKLWLEEPHLEVSDIQKITAPGLVVAGDRDVITPEHTVELYRSLPEGSELCIFPNTSHSVLKEQTNHVNALILKFLQKDLSSSMKQDTDAFDS